jgi:hypothetical protein
MIEPASILSSCSGQAWSVITAVFCCVDLIDHVVISWPLLWAGWLEDLYQIHIWGRHATVTANLSSAYVENVHLVWRVFEPDTLSACDQIPSQYYSKSTVSLHAYWLWMKRRRTKLIFPSKLFPAEVTCVALRMAKMTWKIVVSVHILSIPPHGVTRCFLICKLNKGQITTPTSNARKNRRRGT